MNYKITKEQHKYLCTLPFKQYLFGSQLHGIANENSDYDYVRVISDDFYLSFTSLAKYLPNIHSFQYTEGKEVQYVWMTESQFWRGFFSGDGNMLADVVLLSGQFDNPLHLAYTYKVIKGYIGVTKRDLKLHKDWDKKIFHSTRSLYMAEMLIKKELPNIKDVVELYNQHRLSAEVLTLKEKELRSKLNDMLNKGDIDLYPKFIESNELVQIMANTNNIKEFKYES